MNPESSIGKLMTLGDALLFYQRVAEAEKAMGPLSQEERLIILKDFGKEVTQEEFTDIIQSKKVLYIKQKGTSDE